MGKRTSHPPGIFSWVDLATSDVAAAKAFYTGLFGWNTADSDAGGGSAYTTCSIAGAAVCGLFEDPGAAGKPPNWTSYVTVADAATAARQATELGGGAIAEAFDVLDAGRAAVLQDPQGAVFAVWEPRARIGAEHVNDVGCLCMNELATTDLAAARSFYKSLFGWTMEAIDTGPDGPPTVFAYNGKTQNASLGEVEGDALPHWRPYFTVESTETAVQRVLELGGQALVGPEDHADGSIAIVLDPQGALFGLFEGEVDP